MKTIPCCIANANGALCACHLPDASVMADQLTVTKNELANLKQLWDQQCEHVHLACKLLGVDTDEVIGDSYTLVETAQRIMFDLKAGCDAMREARPIVASYLAHAESKGDVYEDKASRARYALMNIDDALAGARLPNQKADPAAVVGGSASSESLGADFQPERKPC